MMILVTSLRPLETKLGREVTWALSKTPYKLDHSRNMTRADWLLLWVGVTDILDDCHDML